jgi:hypothetical protein
MTDKQKTFTALHGKLAKKFKLQPSQIATIRQLGLGQKKNLAEIGQHLIVKMNCPKKGVKNPGAKNRLIVRNHSQAYYQQMITFLLKCSSDDWKSLMQKTEFDK